MNSQVLEATQAVEVPQIVVTEASPLIQNTTVSTQAKDLANPQDTCIETENVNGSEVQDPPTSEQHNPTVVVDATTSSSEYKPAQECTDCVVPVLEPESQSVETDTEQDENLNAFTEGCCPIGLQCVFGYNRFFNWLDDRFRLPLWLILMPVPLSAGVLGSLYMFSCPAANSLPNAMFLIGISLLAVLSLRVCVIMHRRTCEDGEVRKAFCTMILVGTFVTILFFIAESVMFWRLDSTSLSGHKFCDPEFVKYTLWWNCVMYFVMVPLITFPV